MRGEEADDDADPPLADAALDEVLLLDAPLLLEELLLGFGPVNDGHNASLT